VGSGRERGKECERIYEPKRDRNDYRARRRNCFRALCINKRAAGVVICVSRGNPQKDRQLSKEKGRRDVVLVELCLDGRSMERKEILLMEANF
jgi:hypothetical protein